MRLLSALLFLSTPAFADVNQAIELSQQQHATFMKAAVNMHERSLVDCRAVAMEQSYHLAFDAWVATSIYQFGPIQDIGGPLNIGFWPDKKGFTRKVLTKLITQKDMSINDPELFDQISIAGKGFFALELMMFDDQYENYGQDSYECALVQEISKDLAVKATHLSDSWDGLFSQTLRTAGQNGNQVFLSPDEVAQAFLTSLLTGLEYIDVTRLARPMGSFEKPRPKRAEAWRSNRPIRNIQIALSNLQKLSGTLGEDQAPTTQEAFVSAINFASEFENTDLQQIDQVSVRFQAESLKQLVALVTEAATVEISTHLGVSGGFNALDGD
jgi:predicted lipoprotein